MGNGASKVSNEEKEKVLHDYPHTFLDSLLPHLQSRKTPLRFIWIGGQVACRDQQAKLWYLSDLRKTLVCPPNQLFVQRSLPYRADGRTSC